MSPQRDQKPYKFPQNKLSPSERNNRPIAIDDNFENNRDYHQGFLRDRTKESPREPRESTEPHSPVKNISSNDSKEKCVSRSERIRQMIEEAERKKEAEALKHSKNQLCESADQSVKSKIFLGKKRTHLPEEISPKCDQKINKFPQNKRNPPEKENSSFDANFGENRYYNQGYLSRKGRNQDISPSHVTNDPLIELTIDKTKGDLLESVNTCKLSDNTLTIQNTPDEGNKKTTTKLENIPRVIEEYNENSRKSKTSELSKDQLLRQTAEGNEKSKSKENCTRSSNVHQEKRKIRRHLNRPCNSIQFAPTEVASFCENTIEALQKTKNNTEKNTPKSEIDNALFPSCHSKIISNDSDEKEIKKKSPPYNGLMSLKKNTEEFEDVNLNNATNVNKTNIDKISLQDETFEQFSLISETSESYGNEQMDTGLGNLKKYVNYQEFEKIGKGTTSPNSKKLSQNTFKVDQINFENDKTSDLEKIFKGDGNERVYMVPSHLRNPINFEVYDNNESETTTPNFKENMSKIDLNQMSEENNKTSVELPERDEIFKGDGNERVYMVPSHLRNPINFEVFDNNESEITIPNFKKNELTPTIQTKTLGESINYLDNEKVNSSNKKNINGKFQKIENNESESINSISVSPIHLSDTSDLDDPELRLSDDESQILSYNTEKGAFFAGMSSSIIKVFNMTKQFTRNAKSKLDIQESSAETETLNNEFLSETIQEMAKIHEPIPTYQTSTLEQFFKNLSEAPMMVHSPDGVINLRWPTMKQVCFPSTLKNNLSLNGFNKPTPFQTVLWPNIMRGRSVHAVGPPNCGKTLGILTGLCGQLINYDFEDSFNGPLAIVVCCSSKSANTAEMILKKHLPFIGVTEKKATIVNVNAYKGMKLPKCDVLITLPHLFNHKLDLYGLAYLVIERVDLMEENFYEDIWKIYMTCQNATKINPIYKLTTLAESRTWCGLMKRLVSTANRPLVAIYNFAECAIYSSVNFKVNFTTHENKINTWSSKLGKQPLLKHKTIIVCICDDEVDFIYANLKGQNYQIIKADSSMNVKEASSLYNEWKRLSIQAERLVLVCTDHNLSMLNIMDAQSLIHFSLPSSFTIFQRRFICIVESVPTMWSNLKSNTSINIYIDEQNQMQLSKLINFINRAGCKFADDTNKIIDSLLELQEINRGESYIPLCKELFTQGRCADLTNCKWRHAIIEKYDKSSDWIPKEGFIKFKLMHIIDATHFTIRLIEHRSSDGQLTTYNSNIAEMSCQILAHYLVNKKQSIIDLQVGKICCIEFNQNTYYRCKITTVCTNQVGKITEIRVNLIDKEQLVRCQPYQLFELPECFQSIGNVYVIHMRVINLSPSSLFNPTNNGWKKDLHDLIDQNNSFLNGKIVLRLSNCLWLDSVHCFQKLQTCNRIVVTVNLKKFLLDNQLVQKNNDHFKLLKYFFLKHGVNVPEYKETEISPTKPKIDIPEVQWAHLEQGEVNKVYVTNIITPERFFMTLSKFFNLVNNLGKDLEKYVTEYESDINKIKIIQFEKGEYAIVKNSDFTFSRVRIDSIKSDGSYDCFFVDIGDWSIVESSVVYPITPELISKLPFQAIECTALGIKSLDKDWDSKTLDFFYDMVVNTEGYWKAIEAIPFMTESPKYTNGVMYTVVLFKQSDFSLNELLISNDLAIYQDKQCDSFAIAKSKMNEWLNNYNNSEDSDDDNMEVASSHSTDGDDVISSNDVAEVPGDVCKNSSNATYIDLEEINSIVNDSAVNSETSIEPEISDYFDEDRWDCTFTMDDFNLMQSEIVTSNQNDKSTAKLVEVDNDISESNIDHVFDANIKRGDDVKSTETKISPQVFDRQIEQSVKNLQPLPYKIPCVKWRQDKKTLFIKIILIGVEKYSLDILEYDSTKCLYSINFSTVLRGEPYILTLSLSGAIKKETCNHSALGQYVYIKVAKLVEGKWNQLVKGNHDKRITVDLDHFDPLNDKDNVKIKKIMEEGAIYDAYLDAFDNSDDRYDDEDDIT